MKKFTVVAMVAAALGAGMTGAQKVELASGSYYNVSGCYTTKDGVRCDMTFTSSKQTNGTRFDADDFKVVTKEGASVGASQIALADEKLTGIYTYTNLFPGAPIRLSVLFPLPATTTSLRVLAIEGQPLNNYPVRSSVVSAPRPTTPAAAVNFSAYNAVLTNCKAGAAGVLTCAATLTPRR